MAYIDVQRTGLGDVGAHESAPALRALHGLRRLALNYGLLARSGSVGSGSSADAVHVVALARRVDRLMDEATRAARWLQETLAQEGPWSQLDLGTALAAARIDADERLAVSWLVDENRSLAEYGAEAAARWLHMAPDARRTVRRMAEGDAVAEFSTMGPVLQGLGALLLAVGVLMLATADRTGEKDILGLGLAALILGALTIVAGGYAP
jgi:hypothetical protein